MLEELAVILVACFCGLLVMRMNFWVFQQLADKNPDKTMHGAYAAVAILMTLPAFLLGVFLVFLIHAILS